MNRSALVLPLGLMLNFLYAEPQCQRAPYELNKQHACADNGQTYAADTLSECAELTDQYPVRSKGADAHRSRYHDSFCPLADAWLYEDLPPAMYQQQYGYEESGRPQPLHQHEPPVSPKQYDQVHSSRPVYIQRQEQQSQRERPVEGPAEMQIMPQIVVRDKGKARQLSGVFGFAQNPKLRICRPLFAPTVKNEAHDIVEQTVSCFFENADVEIRRGAGWSLSNAHLKDMHVVRWEFIPGLGMVRCSIDCIVTVKFDQEFKEPPSVIMGIESTDYDRRSSAAMPISEFDQSVVWVPDSLAVCPVEVTTHGFKAKCTLSAQGSYDVRVVYEKDDAVFKKADFRESLQWLFNNIIMGHSLSFTLSGRV